MKLMNKVARLGQVALVAGMIGAGSLMAFAQVASANDARDFKIVNNSMASITKLWIAPSSSDDWEDEMLKGRPIPNGGSKPITFSGDYAEDECEFDLKYVDSKNDTWTFNKINLCELHTLTFKRQGNKVVGTWK